MRKIGLLVLIAAMLLVAPSYSQTTFFNKGENGMGLAFGLLSSDEADGWQLSIGGTGAGVFDFSAGFARVEKTNIFAVGAAWYLFKPRRLADPIAVSLGADIEFTEITSEVWVYTEGAAFQLGSNTRTAQLVNFGLDFHRTMFHAPDALIEFAAGIGMYKLYYENANTEMEPSFSFSVPMVFGNRHSTRFIISLGLSTVRVGDQTESTFSASLGILIGTGRNRSDDDW